MRLWPLCFALTRTAHVATFGQVFDKPFDAPAILVVGHQTDGKSGVRLNFRLLMPQHPRLPVCGKVRTEYPSTHLRTPLVKG
jgi:hypothetical protein